MGKHSYEETICYHCGRLIFRTADVWIHKHSSSIRCQHETVATPNPRGPEVPEY